MKSYWVSWYDTLYGKWEMASPWWLSGERGSDGAMTICAALRAPDEESAKRLIIMAHDEPRPRDLEWRFVTEQSDDWSPFNDRFQKADWMKWSCAPGFEGSAMSQPMHARVVPHSSIVGSSITLHAGPGEPVMAQLAVMAPAGPPPGEDHKQFVERIAKIVAAAINKRS